MSQAGGTVARVRALIAMRRLDEAATVARAGLADDPHDVTLLCALATALIDGGHPDEGRVAAEQAIAVAPDAADAHILRGLALDKVGRGDDAVTSLREAVRLDPYHDGAHRSLAGSLIRQTAGNKMRLRRARRDELLSEAAKHADAALELAPSLPSSHLLQARLALARGRVPAARYSVGEALRLDPNDVAAHQLRGIVAEMSGELGAAGDAYVEAARLDPRSAGVSLRRLRSLKGALPISGVALYVLLRIALVTGRDFGGVFAATAVVGIAGLIAFALVWPRWVAWRALSTDARRALAADRRMRSWWRRAAPVALAAVGVVVTIGIVVQLLDTEPEPSRPVPIPIGIGLLPCSSLVGEAVLDGVPPTTSCRLPDGTLDFTRIIRCVDGAELVVLDDVPLHGVRGGVWEKGLAPCPLG